jgi:hypothetical protein
MGSVSITASFFVGGQGGIVVLEGDDSRKRRVLIAAFQRWGGVGLEVVGVDAVDGHVVFPFLVLLFRVRVREMCCACKYAQKFHKRAEEKGWRDSSPGDHYKKASKPLPIERLVCN